MGKEDGPRETDALIITLMMVSRLILPVADAKDIYITVHWIMVVYGRYLSLQASYRLKYLQRKKLEDLKFVQI